MTLRDALAAALRSITNQSTHLDPCVAYDWTNPREVALSTDMAEAILSDPAFREALVEAVAGAADGIAWEGVRLSRSGIIDLNSDSLARAIVARMLGDEA